MQISVRGYCNLHMRTNETTPSIISNKPLVFAKGMLCEELSGLKSSQACISIDTNTNVVIVREELLEKAVSEDGE